MEDQVPEKTLQDKSRPHKRRLGDRHDGWRIRSLAPIYQLIPYIMKTRSDAQVYFEDEIDITALERWIRLQHLNYKDELGYLHFFVAAAVRTLSQKPRLNRFISGRKIFARNEIQISFAIKKELSEDSPETTIKLSFAPDSTIFEVADKINAAVRENKNLETSNNTDNTARLFTLCPGFLIKFLVWILDGLDHKGLLPKVIHRASPFHTSCFITNLGSLGIKPVFHHIYNFGTTSLFIAFGGKHLRRVHNHRGDLVDHKYIDVKVVADERICDGHYFAMGFRYLLNIFKTPDSLTHRPKEVMEDAR